jgi:diacylglycerol kinase family enzyme
MKHVFVFDPRAFFNQQWKMDNILDNIGQFFRTQENPDFSIQISRYRRNAIYIIENEVEKAELGDIVRIYAIGGDEILYDCLNGAAHFSNMQLAAVSYGELNDFMKILGKEHAESFRDIPTLVQSEALSTDIINWGVNYALNSCYIGMNSAILKNLKDLKSGFNKASFFIVSKILSFVNFFLSLFDKTTTMRKYKIEIDGTDYSGQYSLIHIANGPYFAGKMTGAYTAVPNDGMLDIALIKSAHPLRTLISMRRYTGGKRSKNCVFVQGKKVLVQSDSEMWIQLDNEYFQDTNIELNVVHHAVQMVAVNNLTYPIASIPTV